MYLWFHFNGEKLMSKEYKEFFRRVNDFIVEAVASGDLQRTFHDFGEQNPHQWSEYETCEAIVVDQDGTLRIDDTPERVRKGTVLIGWPSVSPIWVDAPAASPDSDDWLEERKSDFRKECLDLLMAIKKNPARAVDLCNMDSAVDLAWIRIEDPEA